MLCYSGTIASEQRIVNGDVMIDLYVVVHTSKPVYVQ